MRPFVLSLAVAIACVGVAAADDGLPPPAAPARSESYSLLRREVVTDWVASVAAGSFAFGGDVKEGAEDALALAREEGERTAGTIRGAGGRLVASSERLLPLQGDDVTVADRSDALARLVRRRARVDLIVAGPAPEGAIALAPRSTVELELTARRPGGGDGPEARVAYRHLTLEELDRLERDPAAFRRTAAGALLAATWARLVAGYADPDAPEASAVVRGGDLRGTDGLAVELADRALDPDVLGVVLGTRKPLGERLGALFGANAAPAPTLDAEDAALLERSVGRPTDDAGWQRLVALRRESPAEWTAEDRAFLAGTEAASTAAPAPASPSAGLMGAIDR